ncbi:HEAT repeat domain-containing protein [Mesonia aestuariivivens]|uniref:HEAT repeat domain-containing protein n=1 Tax=Mesonia aestuariivivens TaxID=2796128 RepID=A0ABS6W501_9FLAO|nr:HEAT repeat domain-containing protein [Mesonia aestuariivivens]MBW2962925.1 HEAT repeat domain-containing protein [Mesonia aestuariivivens]
MIGRNVSNWLEKIKSGNTEEKNKSANHLLGTSEWYFDDKKVASAERLEIVKDLIELQNDSDPIVRKCVVYLIGVLKMPSKSVNSLLAKMLKDEDEKVQISAVWASGNLGKESAPLIPILSSLSKHQNREVRWRIPWAFKEIAMIDNSLSKVLIFFSKDKDSTARMYALDAIPYCINEIDSDIKKAVRTALKSKDESAGAACRVIQKTKFDWKNTIKRLMKLVKEDNLDAVLALCIQWPEMVNEPIINKWLNNNKGYWWAKGLLNGESVKV